MLIPEMSFSSLRRLKNYMRSTCDQQRPNNIAMCHVHKNIMDAIDVCNVTLVLVSPLGLYYCKELNIA